MRRIISSSSEDVYNALVVVLKSFGFRTVSEKKVLGEILAERKTSWRANKWGAEMKAKILPTSDEELTEVDIEITPKSFLGKAQTLGETNLIFNKLFETALGLHTRGEEITKIPKKIYWKRRERRMD